MESVFRAKTGGETDVNVLVSILGLMESVFRAIDTVIRILANISFNPWFNGICIQGEIIIQ